MSIKNKLILALGAALLLRIALALAFRTYGHPVFFEYEGIANNILSGKGFVYNFLNTPYRSFCNPLYGWLCAGVYALTGHSYAAMLLLQSIASLFLAFIIFKIAGIIFNEKVGLYSAILVAFHPGFLYYDVFNLMPLSIDALFIASITFLFLRFKDSPNAVNMSLVGALIGVGALSRGIIGALAPFLILYIMVFMNGIVARKKIAAIFFLALSMSLVIAPWVIRNYVIHKELLIISTTGETFWPGTNKDALGTSLDKNGKSIIELWPDDFRNKIYALDEMGQKKFFEKEAFDYIRSNPLIFFESYAKKVFYFWWFSPQSGTLYPTIYLKVYRYFYSVLLCFSLLGLALALLSKKEPVRSASWLIAFVFMSIFLTQSFFYIEGRHRWLIEPLLIIFFSYGMTELCRSAKARLGRFA